jgi:hypothetical protein
MTLDIKTKIKLIHELDIMIKPLREIINIADSCDTKTKEIVEQLTEVINKICMHIIIPEPPNER